MNHTLRQHQILHSVHSRKTHRPIPERIAVWIYAIVLSCAIAFVVLP